MVGPAETRRCCGHWCTTARVRPAATHSRGRTPPYAGLYHLPSRSATSHSKRRHACYDYQRSTLEEPGSSRPAMPRERVNPPPRGHRTIRWHARDATGGTSARDAFPGWAQTPSRTDRRVERIARRCRPPTGAACGSCGISDAAHLCSSPRCGARDVHPDRAGGEELPLPRRRPDADLAGAGRWSGHHAWNFPLAR